MKKLRNKVFSIFGPLAGLPIVIILAGVSLFNTSINSNDMLSKIILAFSCLIILLGIILLIIFYKDEKRKKH